MKLNTTSPVTYNFSRSGGAIVMAKIEIWTAKNTGWKLIDQIVFSSLCENTESAQKPLSPGEYTCIFKCYVEESINGVYAFSLDINGTKIYTDSGDVNTTTSQTDSIAYKDQFGLSIQ